MNETEVVRLEVGKPQLRDLSAGETHAYRFQLEQGQYVRLVADQQGIDVVLKLLGPNGAPLREVDTPNGARGPERASEVATASGDYRVEILPSSSRTKPGRYEMRIEELRPATDEDRQRVAAEKVFHEGEALRRQRDWSNARPRYEQALELWRALHDLGGEALALYRLGQTFEGTSDDDRALDLYRQAMAAYVAVEDPYGQATVHNRLGGILLRQEKIGEATEAFQQALAIFQRLGDLSGQAGSLNNLGAAADGAGQVGPAIEAFHQAALLRRQVEDARNEGKSLFNLGGVYVRQGRLDEARDALEAARRAGEESGDMDLVASALGALGELDQRQERLATAQTNLRRAIPLQQQMGDELGKAVALTSLSTTLLKAGDLDGSQQATEEALALFRKLKHTTGEAIALSNFGRIDFARGDDRGAVARQHQARQVFERIGDREGIALARFGAARSLARLGDLDTAQQELEKSLDLIEDLRTEKPGLGFRASFFATKQQYWELQTEILMRLHERNSQQGFAAQALTTSERRRARSLLDALSETRSKVENEIDPGLAAQIREIEARLSLAEKRRQAILDAGGDPVALSAVEAELRDHLARLDLLRTKMRDPSGRVEHLSRPRPLTVGAMQKSLLDSDSLLLVYSLGEERSFLWTVSSRSIVPHVLAGRAKIEAAAQELLAVIPRTSDEAQASEKRAAKAVSDLVLAPAAERIGAFTRLIVVGDGALQLVPFAALPNPVDAARLLVEDHEVVYLPAVSVLAELRQQVRKRKPLEALQVAVLADPVFHADDPRVRKEGAPSVSAPLPPELSRSVRDLDLGSLSRLPYTRQEAESILGIMKGVKPLRAFDFDATRDLFTSGVLNDYHIIHVATHSLLDSRQPDLSGIVFSLVDAKGAPREGFLRLHEIYGLDLKAGLVVLSACETGAGKDLRGEGLIGIAHGFLSAGVPQLVVSLWKVEDRSTAELMRRLYEQIFNEGLPTGAALRRAQLSMLKEPQWSAPHHWAGFIFLGDYRRKAKDGGVEEQDTGGVIMVKKPGSDLPPPKVPPDRPASARPPGKTP
jgi:CHAT domain-containing protein/tetratricopeptide (TPR) repeat protein